MIDIRLQQVNDAATFDTLTQLMVVVHEGDQQFGKAVVFKASHSRAEVVEGLLNLAAAIEQA